MPDFNLDIKIDSNAASAALGRVRRELEQTESVANRATGSFGGFNQMLGQVNSKVGAFSALTAQLGLAGSAFSSLAGTITSAVGALVSFNLATLKADDSLISMRNQLRNVTKGTDELNRAWAMTRGIADRMGADVGDTREAFAKIGGVTKQLGFDMERTGRFTETLGKMMGSSGQSGAAASSAMLQFSQALSSGVLQGDEFKSIAENMPALLDVFAEKLGVTRGKLKEMASEGKITSSVMVSALEGMAKQADISFAQMEKTFAQRTQSLMNEFRDDPRKADRLTAAATGGNFGAIPELIETVAKAPELVPGLKQLGEQFGLTFEPAKVSDFNKQLGEFALKMEKLQRLVGGQVKPELKSFEDQVAAQIETNKKWAEAFDPVNKALSDMQVKANAAKKAITDLGNSDALSSALLSAVVGGPTVASKDKQGNMIARPGGSLFFNTEWQGMGLQAKIEKELELWEKGVAKAKALFESIQGPVRDFTQSQALMSNWLARGAISLDQYNTKLREMYGALSDLDKQRVKRPAPTWAEKFEATKGGPIDMVAIYREQEANDERMRQAQAAPGQLGYGLDALGYNQSLRSMDPTTRYRQLEGANFQNENAYSGAGNQAFEKSLERQIELTRKLSKEQQRSADIMKTAFESLGNSIAEYATGGEMSFKKMVDSMMKDLTRLIIKQLVAAALSAALGGPGGQFGASMAMNIGSGMTPGQAGGVAPRYATGGSFMVGHAATGASYMIRGTGGLDSVPFPLAMVSPGEQVDVHPRSQSGRNDNRSAAPRYVTIHMNDRDEAEFEDMTIRVIHRNPAAIRGAVTGR